MEHNKKQINLNSNLFIKNPFNPSHEQLKPQTNSNSLSNTNGNLNKRNNNDQNKKEQSNNGNKSNYVMRSTSKQPKQSQFLKNDYLESNLNANTNYYINSNNNNHSNQISHGHVNYININLNKEKEKEKTKNENESKLPLTTKNKPVKLIENTILNNKSYNSENKLINIPNNKIVTSKISKKNIDKSVLSNTHSINLTLHKTINLMSSETIKEGNNLKKDIKDIDSFRGNQIKSSQVAKVKVNKKNELFNHSPSIDLKQRSNSVKNQSAPETIDLMSFLNNNSLPINLNVLQQVYPFFENSKYSHKSSFSISAYAANTHQGSIRNYNEDRVSIILNIVKPNTYIGEYWPKCSFFAVYDGHGGSGCAEYLRDNLHHKIIRNSNFPDNPEKAILCGCAEAEEEFINKYALNLKGSEIIDKSGSCAVFSLIVDDICYIGNIGDSRAIYSKDNGKEVVSLTIDHKPNEESESKRIYQNGGRVYQTLTSAFNLSLISPRIGNSFHFGNKLQSKAPSFAGPSRIFPGRLSVSRSFGDVEAKLQKFGGMSNVLIATPEVVSFKIIDNSDFIILGCDGVYDVLKNEDIVKGVYLCISNQDLPNINLQSYNSYNNYSNCINNINKQNNIHQICGKAVDLILKSCLERSCLDNITSVLISFNGFDERINNTIGGNKLNSENQSQKGLSCSRSQTNLININPDSSSQIENNIYLVSEDNTKFNKNLSLTERKWKTKDKQMSNIVVPPICDNRVRNVSSEKRNRVNQYSYMNDKKLYN